MKTNFTEQEIDQILADVEQTLNKAEELAKSSKPEAKLAKADEDKKDADDSAPPMPSDAPPAPAADAAPAAPPADAPPSADAPPAEAPADEPPMDAAPAEPGAEDAELSDEELDQIYASMKPEELERHYMIIRKHLQAAYAGADQQAPAPEAPAPEAPAAAPAEAPPEMAMKSEKEESKPADDLVKKENEDLKKQLSALTTVIEKVLKPSRKAVTGIEYIKKSEAEETQPTPLSKAEITVKLNEKVKDPSLSKEDRKAINNFMLFDEGKEKIEKILGIGGKN